MQEALREAKKAYEADEVPVGAVICHKGRIIARAHNQVRLLKDPTAHAEILAITQAADYLKNERLNGCFLYVTLEPCPMCVGAMILARIEHLYFGARDPKAGACGSVVDLTKAPLNHELRVFEGEGASESAGLLQEFFALKRASAKKGNKLRL